MKALITLFTLFWASICPASPVDCKVSDESVVIVTMEVPHPDHALVRRPGGETGWLQASSGSVHKQMPSFGELEKCILSSESTGTVWVNGKAMVQPIIKGNGTYQLYVAENTETEPANTYSIECAFVIGDE